ncbi:MAG TPA: pyridoxamine 5'-phosphate oxidase family protein [Methanomassiliicoccales archaeon]|nr:pyridoxamine 5'-phosphate oxidase family protein [Methanomassiliicoccales archaeon]HPR98418.1 pyridoxamine 5'-phosphate oxidase family protein [Methanomassiliicoccales archaeon]
MVKMPTEVKEALAKQKPIPIATATRDGTPNVVFVGLMKIIDDESLLLVDNFFLKTAANLSENPRISILCYDTDTKKSYQIKGSAKVYKAGPMFDEMRKWVQGVNPKLPAKAAVVVKVEAVYDAMWGPSAGRLIV